MLCICKRRKYIFTPHATASFAHHQPLYLSSVSTSPHPPQPQTGQATLSVHCLQSTLTTVYAFAHLRLQLLTTTTSSAPSAWGVYSQLGVMAHAKAQRNRPPPLLRVLHDPRPSKSQVNSVPNPAPSRPSYSFSILWSFCL
jgi:hypothetical protein